mmetsp:Transcript_8136/g.19398  ORF Transcript_8136/g.19398 Transcript_8136/m.19398 type:complete len:245 (+) Transcript_8136:721-1455(+)
MLFLLCLLLCGRHFRQLQDLAMVEILERHLVVRRQTPKPKTNFGKEVLKHVGNKQPEQHEDSQLRLYVQEALISEALHGLTEERLMLFEESHIVERKEGVHELEHHALAKERCFILRLRPMVLIVREKFCKHIQQEVGGLYISSNAELEQNDAMMHFVLDVVANEEENQNAKHANARCDRHGCSTHHVIEDALGKRIVWLCLRSHRVDELFSRVLRPVWLKLLDQVHGSPANGTFCLLPAPEVW